MGSGRITGGGPLAAASSYLAVFALCTAAQLGGSPAVALLRYQREAILGGEWWRLLSGHLVHLGWTHWALNMAGLAVCLLVDPGWGQRVDADRSLPDAAASARASGSRTPRSSWLRGWAVRFALLCAGVGLLLLWLSPRIVSYVGLSGVIYGLFVLALWPRARRGEWLGWVGLALVIGRMAMQLLLGPSTDEEARLGGRIIAQAHLYGVLGAVVLLLGEEICRRLRRRVDAGRSAS